MEALMEALLERSEARRRAQAGPDGAGEAGPVSHPVPSRPPPQHVKRAR